MRYRKCLAIFAVSLLLVLTTGCRQTEDKPLWERLEEEQYNSYKPRLNYMVEKYGDMFEMDIYGTVTCIDPEYKDWQIACDGASDNFSIRLRRDDLELFIKEIAELIFGECKVYVTRGRTSTLDMDADTEEFFTDKYALVSCWIYVPYSDDYQAQGEAFMATIVERGYKLFLLDVLYVDAEQYEQADRSGINFAKKPDGYQFRLNAWFDDGYEKFSFKWEGAEE